MAIGIPTVRNSSKNNARNKAPRFDYSTVSMEDGEKYILQVQKIESYTDEEYGSPDYNYQKVRISFVAVIPGWDAAMYATEEEQNSFPAQGHGKLLSKEYNPIATKPGVNSKGAATNPSNLYKDLVLLLGRDPSDEELGIEVSKPALAAFTKEWNAKAQANNEAEKDEAKHLPVATDEYVAKAIYRAVKLQELLNNLERERPMIYGFIEEKVAKRSGKTYYRIGKLGKLVPAKSRPASFKPYPRPLDPREAGEEPIYCEVDPTERIRGYENGDGEWVSAAEAAEQSRERYGKAMSGLTIWRLRQAGELPEPSASPATSAAADEDDEDALPF